MAAGFPTGGSPSKGQPQVQFPMGNYLAGRSYGGGMMGGGTSPWSYGPQSPYKKRGYQLARPGIGGGGDSMEGGYGGATGGGPQLGPTLPGLAGQWANMFTGMQGGQQGMGMTPFPRLRPGGDVIPANNVEWPLYPNTTQAQTGVTGYGRDWMAPSKERLTQLNAGMGRGMGPMLRTLGGQQGAGFGAMPDILRKLLEARAGL